MALAQRLTYSFKESELEKKWYVVDASGKTLGRVASRVAHVLRGKHKPQFTSNTDTCIFKDALMIAGLKLKFFEAKGLDTTKLEVSYLRELEKAKGQNKGAPTLNLSPRTSTLFISPGSIPDGTIYGR